MTERPIKAVKSPAHGGYASAAVLLKPWLAYAYGRPLLDKNGRPRRFATEAAALAAARKKT